MDVMFRDSFTGYIGPPTTALLLLPFTLLAFPQAVLTYRIVIGLVFVSSIVLTGLALPPRSRPLGWLVGTLAFLLFNPVIISIGLGQIDAWVMLALSAGILTSSKEKWALSGVFFGLATLLKVSPALIIFYLLLRGKRTPLVGALIGIVVALGLSVVIGKPDDLVVFIRDISPSLSNGSIHTQNQSLAAWLARLISPDTNLLNFNQGTTPFNLLVLVAICVALVLIAYFRRGRPFIPTEYAPVILLALLAGPISWEHYATWAILALILTCDKRLWEGEKFEDRRKVWVAVMGVGAFLFMMPTLYFSPEAISANWILRLATGTKTLALLLWLAVDLALIFRRSEGYQGVSVSQRPSTQT